MFPYTIPTSRSMIRCEVKKMARRGNRRQHFGFVIHRHSIGIKIQDREPGKEKAERRRV
jgi:hypothetical protein